MSLPILLLGGMVSAYLLALVKAIYGEEESP